MSADTKPGKLTGCASRLRSFFRSEHGGASVEVMLWIPAFAGFFFLLLEATNIFYSMGQIRRVLMDGNRYYVMGGFDENVSTLETWIETTIDPIAPNAFASASIDSSGRLNTRVMLPYSDVDFTGLANVLGNFGFGAGAVITITTVAQMEI